MPQKRTTPVEEEEMSVETPLGLSPVSILALSAEEVESAVGFHPVASGTYDINIISAVLRFGSKGGPLIELGCAPVVEDDPMAGMFSAYINLPSVGQDDRQRKARSFEVKEFAQSLHANVNELIEMIQNKFSELTSLDSSVPLEDLIGLAAQAILTLDPEGVYFKDGIQKTSPERNSVRRWIP